MGSGGRPPLYSDPEVLSKKVDEFIESFTDSKSKPSVTGFAVFLGFSSRDTLYQYEKKPEFSDSIKKGMLFVEKSYEERLLSTSPVGAIFALKNMGWKDKQEGELTGEVKLKVVYGEGADSKTSEASQ